MNKESLQLKYENLLEKLHKLDRKILKLLVKILCGIFCILLVCEFSPDLGLIIFVVCIGLFILIMPFSIKRKKLSNKILPIYKKLEAINEQERLQLEQQIIRQEQEIIQFIKSDPVFRTCTNDKLREIYLYNILYNADGSVKEHLKDLSKKYFYITNQRTFRLTDNGVWLLHYLQNYELIDAQNQQI